MFLHHGGRVSVMMREVPLAACYGPADQRCRDDDARDDVRCAWPGLYYLSSHAVCVFGLAMHALLQWYRNCLRVVDLR